MKLLEPPTKTTGSAEGLEVHHGRGTVAAVPTEADQPAVSVLAFVVLIPVSGETPVWARLPRNIGQFANPAAPLPGAARR